MNYLLIFAILGLIAFMLSGAMVAIKYKMDLGGTIFLTAITGLGGGTIRDILLQTPIFWLKENGYVYAAIIIAIITFYSYHQLKKHITMIFFERMLELFDILGTASFMIIGVSTAQQHHQSPFIAVVMSVITCTGGSILRDIVCSEIPLVFRKALYATSVVLGSIVYLVVDKFNNESAVAFSCLFLIIFRLSAKYYNLSLPKVLDIK